MNTRRMHELARRLGPGLITGAADDDPSGIATYYQAGSQFRFGLVWTLLLTTPLMIGIQMLSARIGWVTGEGLGAMGEAVRLLAGGRVAPYIIGFGALSVVSQVYFSYESTVRILNWLTLALFSYVAVILSVQMPWRQVMAESFLPWSYFPPGFSLTDYASIVVAVLGTTISPYLFFWQAAQEVEDKLRQPDDAALMSNPTYTAEHMFRIKQDTFVGMLFSKGVALCIVLATAVTLNQHGVTNILTAAQAAEALRPVAGDFAFTAFALGIIGTGLLAVPVLAGSAAYAVCEVLGWRAGLSHDFHQARGFYAIIMAATVLGTVMGSFEVDPIKALVWSAIINGVIAVPFMVVMMMRIGQSVRIMGDLTITPRHRFFGWAATVVMAIAVLVMLATSF